MDLSPDFYYSSHDANGWQLNQSIQRAVSSDAISSASCRVEGTPLENHTYGAPLRNRTFSGGVVNNLSHSHSMILPTQRIPATGKCDLRMMLEAPSPESEVHTPKPGSSRPESSVDLRGAQLQWAAELSSKRNVFKLRTVTGNEFLLQSDSDALIRDWYRSIQNIIHRLDEENPLDNVLLFSLRRAGSVELLDHSGDEDEERGEVKEASLPRSRSNLEHAEQKRVKSRLKKLILRRPPLQALHEKGLIKDQVFGCALELLCEREKSSVPQFVRRCTEAVERRGLESDGIYRVSGNLAVVQKLRFAVNHEHLDLDAPQWEDIHVISGALKLFFRELPNPLIPFNMYHSVIRSVQLCDHQERLERLKLLVSSLPACNRDTLRHMIQHLRRPENDSGNIAINMVYQNQAIEILLSDYQQIFEHEPIRGMLTTPTN
ncbi:hypothetical protein DNTS_032898 [Danionella cerebrum]|uniref:Rho-GAP domain-containing protein n=1 Tax=Danionella cerebrum TaxID=2873325 RepID=A0A553R5C2_9TELE|nr:hypothetical protein DNTS_032898 [Danionella translucida]